MGADDRADVTDDHFGTTGEFPDTFGKGILVVAGGLQDGQIVLTEALELSALDYEEFLGSYESMTLSLASHLRELGSYREAR